MKIQRILNAGIISALLFISFGLSGQNTEGFNYQAVARTSNGDLLAEKEITVVLNILDPSEKSVWEERHTLTTNSLGLFNIPVGTIPSAVTEQSVEQLSDLNWNSEAYSLNITVDGNDLGLNPILSVPRAFYGRDEDADPQNEIQDLQFANGNLTITNNGTATNIDLGTYVSSEMAWQKDANNALLTSGAVGVGTASPEGVLDVVGSTPGDDPIFQVKNTDGVPVFAVYNEGVRILFPDDITLEKGVKGGFAVGGYNASKATESGRFLEVLPEGSNISFYTDNSTKAAGQKGGFAVGGYNATKDVGSSYIYMDPYAEPLSNDGGTIIFIPLFDALNEKGNCYIGTLAGQNREGHFNTSIGYQSGYAHNVVNTGSFPLLFYNTASYNTYLGSFSGYSNIIGDLNTYLGYQAGYLNVGSGNVFLGYQAGAAATNTSNKLYIENSDTNFPLIYGDFETDDLRLNASVGINRSDSDSYGLIVDGGTSSSYSMIVYKGAYAYTNGFVSASDASLKTEVETIEDALGLVSSLRGVSYKWKDGNPENLSDKKQIGLIAQEVEEVLPEVVSENDEGLKGVSYDKLTAVLVEAVKEQQQIIEKQQQEIDELRSGSQMSSAEILRTIQDMEATINKLNLKIESMERVPEE